MDHFFTTGWFTAIPSSVRNSLPTFADPTHAVVPPTPCPPVIPSVIPPTQQSLPYPEELPQKLVKRITNLEFIEMSELLFDNWSQDDDDTSSSQSPRTPRKGPVTSITLWIECYSVLASVLAAKYPDKILHLLAYQRTIIKAQRQFLGNNWVLYDTRFRRKAANTKSLDWGTMDSQLYNEIFVGRAKATSRCQHCLSEFHISTDCPNSNSGSYGNATPPPPKLPRQSPPAIPICLLYNSTRGDICNFAPNCKFIHACSHCHGRHPISRCPTGASRPPTSNRSSRLPQR